MAQNGNANGSSEKKEGKGKHDPYIGSKSVTGLEKTFFERFLSAKDAVLVMFYNPESSECDWSKRHFIRAAKTTERDNHGYGAVDCTKQKALCDIEISDEAPLPVFKLYSRGHVIDTYRDNRHFPFFTMKRFVENAPLISDPSPPSCAVVGKPCR